MKGKRILASMLTATMALGCLTGCSQTEETAAPKETQSTQAPTTAAAVKTTEAAAESTAAEAGGAHVPFTTEPITISILLDQPDATYNAVQGDEMWFFKYLEWWMNQQGYNITLEVTNASDITTQLSLMLASDDLPDLVWGKALTNAQFVTYGIGEEMLLDWSPYLNEEYMPHLMAMDKVSPQGLLACTVQDSVFSLPAYNVRGYGYMAGNAPTNNSVFVNTKWMEQCGITELPKTYDEFIDMLRAFKTNITLEDGKEVIPWVSRDLYIGRHLWSALGYYCYSTPRNGAGYAIKDGELQYMALTEDYRSYVEIMKTMYEEGLVSPDYLTLDTATSEAIMANGQGGVIGSGSLGKLFPDSWTDWVALGPVSAGNNDEVIVQVNADYNAGLVWASANTEYPEVLAYMLDYLYSEEGSVFYHYGPQKGQDPLGLISGWFINEKGEVSFDEVESGAYDSTTHYVLKHICPKAQMFNNTYCTFFAKDIAGVPEEMEVEAQKDVVLGDTWDVVWMKPYNRGDSDGYHRIEIIDAYKDNMTRITLPSVYLSEEDSTRATELNVLLTEYISSESAKFITGLRPISEVEKFQEEIRAMGAEEYIQLYREAYSDYLDSIFK